MNIPFGLITDNRFDALLRNGLCSIRVVSIDVVAIDSHCIEVDSGERTNDVRREDENS